MGLFKAIQRRKWKRAVAIEFKKQHAVDLRTVSGVIGRVTLDGLLNDEYELEPQDPVSSARDLTHMLNQAFRLDPASLGTRTSP